MASAGARAYNGGLGAVPPAGVQGAKPPEADVKRALHKSIFAGFLANVNSRSRSLYVIGRPSVCRLSVCNVRAPYSGD